MVSKVSKTIDLLGIGKKPPSQYEFKSQEKLYHELAMRAFDQSEKKPKKMAVDCSEMGVAPLGDRGFLSAVVFSYNNHYILQTTPEDWWYTIIHKIGTTVKRLTDVTNREPASENERKLRRFFVSHEGKKTLRVFVPPIPLEEQDFTKVFHNLTEQIRDNSKVPKYTETVRADFSTSTPTHIIESEITLMSSLQNFFEYRMCCLCGIPQIEMIGSEADWRKLKDKFVDLRKVLAPVEACFGNFQDWCTKVEVIFQKLIDTYLGNPDIEWWSHIFNKGKAWGSGPRNLTGWFINDFLNCQSVKGFKDLPSGLNTVPLILEGAGNPVPVKTTLVAGIAGIQVEDSIEVPKVRALHGWALFYNETDSPVKGKGRKRDLIWMNHVQMATTNREERSLELHYTKKWKETGSDRPVNKGRFIGFMAPQEVNNGHESL